MPRLRRLNQIFFSCFSTTLQYYVCNGQIPTETQDEGYTAFIEYMDSGAEGDKFDGFELVARLHMPES